MPSCSVAGRNSHPSEHAPLPAEMHCDTVHYDNGDLSVDENQLDRAIGCDPSTAKFDATSAKFTETGQPGVIFIRS
jgi:hypothetical protein